MPTNEIRWPEYIQAYLPVMVSWTLMASLLALPNYSYSNAILQAIFVLVWSYAGHVFAHKVSSDWPFNILNPHVYLHHKKSVEMPRWLELVIEATVNFFGFFILYILQRILGLHIFSTSLLLGAAFLYITIHILDYSIIGKEDHSQHHLRTFCNYDPEFFDTLFSTRCDPEKPYTNMNTEIPHGILAFSFAFLIKIIFNLD